MPDPGCPCSPTAVDRAFRESEPFIDQQITDRSYKMRRYLIDMAPVLNFPDGVGYELSKVRFFGDIGPQYDGFDGWRSEQRSRDGGDACGEQHDACGYVWEEVGHGFEELHYSLMNRDLKTVPICVADIRTFWQFKQFQDLIFKNLAEISANMKEQLVRNALIGFSVKNVITSAGLQINSANPYELPNVAGVTLGKLNFRVLKRLYNALLREAGTYALTTVNGRPVFGLMASDDVLDDVFIEDPDVRQDIRNLAAGGDSAGQSLLSRYNFFEGIRNMFVLIPDMYAARYRDDGSGNLIRVFPYERDVMIQNGARPAPNPDYETAPYELPLVITRDIFNLRRRGPLTSVGGETNFEAETGMFDWRWHNPERYCDPNRRKGFYYANGQIGIEPGDFTDIPAILVARRPMGLDAAFWPANVCPPVAVDCDNELALQGCPCPQIVGCNPDYTNENVLQLRLSKAPATPLVIDDVATILLSNGGTIAGVVTGVGPDDDAIVVDFGEEVECCVDRYIELVCDTDNLQCASDAVTANTDITGLTHAVRLQEPLKATAAPAAVIQAVLSDGTEGAFTITIVDADTLTYTGTTVDPIPAGLCIAGLRIPNSVDGTCEDTSSVDCSTAGGLP